MMRIATNQYSQMMSTALQTATAQMDALNLQLATGQQYTAPSQDPVATVQLDRLSRNEADITQYQSNITTLQNKLSVNESYLNSISNDILSAHDLLVQAANGSNNAADESAIASSLQPLMQSMLYTANSTDAEGHYIFSGTMTNTPAITYNPAAAIGARYTFTGNANQQLVAVGSGVTQPANVALPQMATLLNQLDTAQSTLSAPGVNVNTPAVSGLVAATITGVETTLGSISGTIASLGGEQNILSTMNTNFSDINLTDQQESVSLGQVNYAATYTQLTGYTTAVQAAQQAYSQVSKLSLFNVV
jgi:flagellar hook-associated protein 3 FlgL